MAKMKWNWKYPYYKREVYPILYFVFLYIDVFVTQLHVLSVIKQIIWFNNKTIDAKLSSKKFSWRFNIQLKYFQGTYWQLFQNLEINLSNSVNFSSKAIKFKLYRSFVMYTCICLNNRVAGISHRYIIKRRSWIQIFKHLAKI